VNSRNAYLEQLIRAKDKPQIKVITGVRRSGKSTLLDLFADYLRQSGIGDSAIIEINFELMAFDEIRDYKQLYELIEKRRQKGARTYLLLDEIGRVEEWEKAVAGLQADKKADVDIYITVSNATLLSSELSTLLGGRYLEIRMQPLAFSEYLEFLENDHINNSVEDAYYDYTKYGGFPGIFDMGADERLIESFLEGIYHSILIKDVAARNAVRDIDLLERIVRFVAANIGNPLSTRKVSDYLISLGRKASQETVDNYLSMLAEAFIIYKARNFDIKGKRHLVNLGKYYFVDIGLRNFLSGSRGEAAGSVLENQVFLELLFRGYRVSVGKLGDLEVDFVCEKNGLLSYYQVTTSMADDAVRERELRPLRLIRDNYPKYVISTDKTPLSDFDGVTHLNIIEFLRG